MLFFISPFLFCLVALFFFFFINYFLHSLSSSIALFFHQSTFFFIIYQIALRYFFYSSFLFIYFFNQSTFIILCLVSTAAGPAHQVLARCSYSRRRMRRGKCYTRRITNQSTDRYRRISTHTVPHPPYRTCFLFYTHAALSC